MKNADYISTSVGTRTDLIIKTANSSKVGWKPAIPKPCSYDQSPRIPLAQLPERCPRSMKTDSLYVIGLVPKKENSDKVSIKTQEPTGSSKTE